ncbi:polysaccharide deacetylase family protein [Streptomyces sp. NPDC057743]|uniref:polysaccharide deacetylase family protein n=1 Tax=Streptomyces sp. NPDC057743 TaxID=3346236 RepID=UPI0036BDA57A
MRIKETAHDGPEVSPMDNQLYDYSPITERAPISWPGGARIAFYVGVNVEHYQVDRPSTSIFPGTTGLAPDPLNYGWRDYGPRVGIWRLMESLDRHGIRASVLLNSDVGERYPQIIEAGRARNWAWLAHGKNNSVLQADMTPDEERAYLTEVVDTIERTTGHRPRGWLGPALTETFRTPELLAELGLSYVLDWTNDDQPYRLNVPGMFSVPYPIELNDISLFVGKSLSGPDFVQIVKDQLDQLYADAAGSGRVMSLALHPFVIGQPFRHTYLDQALELVAQHPGVWLTTSDEIAEHYARTTAGQPA